MARQRAARPAPGGAGRRPGPGHRTDQRPVLDAALRQRQQAPGPQRVRPEVRLEGEARADRDPARQLRRQADRAAQDHRDAGAVLQSDAVQEERVDAAQGSRRARDVGRCDDEGRHPAVRRRQCRPALRQPASARHLLQQLLLARAGLQGAERRDAVERAGVRRGGRAAEELVGQGLVRRPEVFLAQHEPVVRAAGGRQGRHGDAGHLGLPVDARHLREDQAGDGRGAAAASSRPRRPIRSSCSASAPISRSTPPRRSPRAAPWCSTG